jgi:hypothetical protein
MNSLFTSQRFLVLYSGALTTVFAVTMLTGFADAERHKHKFDEVTVQRINIVEPDGTLRMVISNKELSPGIFMKGREYPVNAKRAAGILFLNDEGSENGGLTFGGRKDADGKVISNGHLSFDQYMQDQVFSIDAGEYDGQRSASLGITDRPDYPITELLELLERIKDWPPQQQQAEITRFNASHPQPFRRIRLGRGTDKSVALEMKDLQGRDRVVMKVDANGNPKLQFLDAQGKVISELPK